MTVPLKEVEADPAMRELLEDAAVSLWLGDGCCAHGFPLVILCDSVFLQSNSDPFLQTAGKFALHFYVPHPSGKPIADYWGTPAVSPSLLLSSIGDAEPRLRKLVTLASPASAIRYQHHQEVEDEDDWILPSSLGSVLGDAAHPAPPACIQASAMAFEDAAVFAKLFSHMRRPDQAASLLNAFATLRADRVRKTLEADVGNIMYMMIPYGKDGAAEARDEGFRAATKAGKSILGDASAQEQWDTTLATWIYGQCPSSHGFTRCG
jgi:salicylate hydroxylase